MASLMSTPDKLRNSLCMRIQPEELAGHHELRSAIKFFTSRNDAPIDQRWEYPMVPAIGGLEKATRFSPIQAARRLLWGFRA